MTFSNNLTVTTLLVYSTSTYVGLILSIVIAAVVVWLVVSNRNRFSSRSYGMTLAALSVIVAVIIELITRNLYLSIVWLITMLLGSVAAASLKSRSSNT
ncbi:MAG: hypothetical protein M0Z77_01795 [Thermoplasmatales archaeon]|nr:hypothetical protein [Candidatus Thermoplasmatota archaeon]MDA8054369.1 hypothetical protein [Thermoplasmatales archaeon]